jgi:hypothetical protein
VRVRCDEGLVIRIGPEPCAVVREGAGEASAGERAGQPLSRVSDYLQGAEAVTYAEGDTVTRSDTPARVSCRPCVV